MTSEKHVRLMSEYLDGTIKPRQRLKLQEYLRRNPDAQMLYDSFLQLFRWLAQEQKADPPMELKHAVLRQVRAEGSAGRKNRGIPESVVGSLALKVNVKYAYSLLAGIVVGIFSFALLVGSIGVIPPWNIRSLAGSIYLGGAVDSVQVADQIDFTIGNAEGTVRIEYSTGTVIAEIDLTSNRGVEVTISFDNRHLDLEGMRQLGHVPKTLEINENQVRLTQDGEEKYFLLFKDKSNDISAMQFRVRSSDDSWEETLYTRQHSH